MKAVSYETEFIDIKETWAENLQYSLKDIFMIYKTKYIETVALQNLNLDIFRGEFIAIMGPSGSGKSSLLNILSGIISPTVGRIYFNQNSSGKDIIEISKFNIDERCDYRRENIGYIFQNPNLFDYLTVEENIQVPILIQKKDPDKEIEWITELLNSCGIEHRRKYKIEQLSGGERQRVQIACSLIIKPKIVIADEPTGNLDAKNAVIIFDLFKEINQKYKTTILIATHDEKVTHYSKRILYLEDGSLHEF